MGRKSEFNDYVAELLSAFGDIQIRSMFGGHGVYCDGLFVAIIADETLFFKTDDETRGKFLEKKCNPFSYQSKGKKVSLTYFEVPSEAMDSSESIAEWVKMALMAAKKAAAKKKAVPSRRQK